MPDEMSELDHLRADVEMLNEAIEGWRTNNENLKELVHDCLAVIIGWSWALNEYKGVAFVDDSSPATQTMKELLRRAKNLGVET